MCTSIAMLLPMRRVRRLCGILTSGFSAIISIISCWVSFGSERSRSSFIPTFIRSIATFMISAATTIAAIGSAILHLLPRKYAQPTPMNVPIDDSASLRWCQAFAITAGEFTFLPIFIVCLYSISLLRIDTAATISAISLGFGSSLPCVASIILSALSLRIPMPTIASAIPIIVVASVSYLP